MKNLFLVFTIFLAACTNNSVSNNSGVTGSNNQISGTVVDISRLSNNSSSDLVVSTIGTIDFGQLSPSSELAQRVITVSNTSTGSISFSFDPSQLNQFQVLFNHCPASLLPGGTCSLMLDFNNRGLYNGTYGGALTISDATNPNQIIVPLTASVINNPDPASTDGSVSPNISVAINDPYSDSSNTEPYRVITFANNGTGDAELPALVVGQLFPGSSDLSVLLSHCGATLPPGQSCQIFILNTNFRTKPITKPDVITLNYNGTGSNSSSSVSFDVFNGVPAANYPPEVSLPGFVSTPYYQASISLLKDLIPGSNTTGECEIFNDSSGNPIGDESTCTSYGIFSWDAGANNGTGACIDPSATTQAACNNDPNGVTQFISTSTFPLGPYGSDPTNFVTSGSLVYFIINDSSVSNGPNQAYGYTDGTTGNTAMITGTESSTINFSGFPIVANGYLFFFDSSLNNGMGGITVAYENTQYSVSLPQELTAIENIFAALYDSTKNQYEIIATGQSPGGSLGTIFLTLDSNFQTISYIFNSTQISSLYYYQVVNGNIVAQDQSSRLFIISADRSSIEYVLSGYNINLQLALLNNGVLYFTAIPQNSSSGDGLYKTDGTVSGTSSIKVPGVSSSYAFEGTKLAVVNNKLVFNLNASVGTTLLNDGGIKSYDLTYHYVEDLVSYNIISGQTPDKTHYASSLPFSSTVLNGYVFSEVITSYDGGNQKLLYITDGTLNGTSVYLDLQSQLNGFDIESLIVVNNQIFFVDNSYSANLWQINQETKSLVQVNIASVPNDYFGGLSYQMKFNQGIIGNKLIFAPDPISIDASDLIGSEPYILTVPPLASPQ